MMVNNTNQIQAKRKKKFTGGNASKRHRDRVNIEFNNLAKLLPFPENVIAKLDKSSILRLAVSYIRAKSFFKDALPVDQEESSSDKQDSPSSNDIYKGILEETCLTEFFLQALDGFLIVITEDLKVLYVSESVRDYLGYCQAGIIHESFLQFIHWGDEENVKKVLKFDKPTNGLKENDIKSTKSKNLRAPGEEINGRHELNGRNGDSNPNSCVQSRRFVCRMKCAFSCSSRFYTAFQAFQFSGHVRRSTIQEGKEQRTLNTLIAFGSPSTNSKFDPSELVSDTFEESRSCPDEEPNGPNVKMVGLHIEPRLRPHIAPIPIPQNEAEGRMLNQSQPFSYNRHFSMNPRLDPAYNGTFASRMTSSYPRLISDYYREGPMRYENGWAARASSLSNSPISDASSPRGVKRSMSLDASPENNDIINARKHGRFEEKVFGKSQNGFNVVPLDDIHSSANILMQLKATQKKLVDNLYVANGSESDSSSDEKVDRIPTIQRESRFGRKYEERNMNSLGRSFQPGGVNGNHFVNIKDFSHVVNGHYPAAAALNYNMNGLSLRRKSEIGTRAFENQDFYREAREANESSQGVIRCKISSSVAKSSRPFPSTEFPPATSSPSQDAKNEVSPRVSSMNAMRSSPSRLSPTKKDSKRGFHISTILGLDEEPKDRKVAGQLNDSCACDVEESSNHVTKRERSPIMNAVCTERAISTENGVPIWKEETRERGKVLLRDEVATMDDVKSSFAQVLQVFTATMTRTIDTILKP